MHSMRTPVVPSDVWTHVASFLSVRDAARLSGQEVNPFKGSATSCCCHYPVPTGDIRSWSDRTADCLHLLQVSAGMHRGFR